MFVDYLGLRKQVIALWPTMSTRDIARELDVTVSSVETQARHAGLASRPTAYVPGQKLRRPAYQPRRA
jgi:hypothetical protein